jgi:hypothetical protein
MTIGCHWHDFDPRRRGSFQQHNLSGRRKRNGMFLVLTCIHRKRHNQKKKIKLKHMKSGKSFIICYCLIHK